MENQKYLNYFCSLVEIGLKVMNPFEEDVKTRSQKMTRMFVLLTSCHISMLAVLLMFSYGNIGIKATATLTEAIVLAVIDIRECVYIFLIYVYVQKFTEMFQKLMQERKSTRTDDSDQTRLTLQYCKAEFLVTAVYVPNNAFLLFLSATLCVYLFPNEYSLPINATIFLLPFEKFSFFWIVNYAYQLVYLTAASVLFYTYVVMNLILMNQTCWYFDSALLLVKKLTSEYDSGSNSVPKSSLDLKRVEEFVEFNCNVSAWQDDVQTIMRFSLLAEITLFSSIFCLCVFNVTYFSAVLLFSGTSQLFLYCWFGTRTIIKAEKLAAAIYDLDWYQLRPVQRKTVLVLMVMAQSTKSLSAIFMDINFETFQTIMEFSYSLLALLHSTI